VLAITHTYYDTDVQKNKEQTNPVFVHIITRAIETDVS